MDIQQKQSNLAVGYDFNFELWLEKENVNGDTGG